MSLIENSSRPSHGQALVDPNRLSAVAASGLLDTAPEETFDRFTRLATRLLGAPVSLFSVITDERQFFKSADGLGEKGPGGGSPIGESFCQYVVTGGEPLRIEDSRKDARVASSPYSRNGSVIAYLGVPIHTEDGSILGSLCVADGCVREWSDDDLRTLQDLGSALSAEVRLRERTQALADILKERHAFEKEREIMIRLLVHDLRSPVAAVVSTLELLDDDPAAVAENRDLIDLARSGAEDLLTMINEMLEIHRLADGRMVIEREEFSANDLLRRVFAQMMPLADAAGQTLEVSYPPTELTVNADSSLVKRVLVNLIANAVKYSGSGARIVVGAASDRPCFFVRDNGPGIPPELRESIFAVYERGAEARRGNDVSFGLGLAFCRLVADAHGGRIWVEDAPGGGSFFQIELPA